MKNKLWLLGALVVNIASAFNWYGYFFNLLFGLHIAISIWLLSKLFIFNITINMTIPKDTEKKEYEFMVIEYQSGWINTRLQEAQAEGWEIAGNSNIKKSQDGLSNYVSVPLKRLKSNN
jgi:hypothetical protein